MRRMIRVLALGLAVIVIIPRAQLGAQQSNDYEPPASPIVFLDKSYFVPAGPIGRGYVFSAEASAHLFFFNHLGDPRWGHEGGWRLAMPVSMQFVVRMDTSFSAPVRTPSYHIRPLYLQAFYTPPEKSEHPEAFSLLAIAGGLTHYSNGQSGCTYQGFVADSTHETCVPADTGLARRRIANIRDGSFSTTYFSIDVHYRSGRMRKLVGPVEWQQTLGFEFQLHPLGFVPGGSDGDQAREYGLHQATLSYEVERRLFSRRLGGVLRVSTKATQRFAFAGGKAPSLGDVEASYVVDAWQDVGPFIRLHWGADDYNIHFQDTRPFLMFGVMWDQGRLDVIKRKGSAAE
jgi:hypothetical protein